MKKKKPELTETTAKVNVEAEVMPPINFKEALQILGIEEYEQKIFNSNSHGELFHLMDYIQIAKWAKETTKSEYKPSDWFKQFFEDVIDFANKNWSRPESVYQHIPKFLEQYLSETA